ncbi:hypothetical protein IFR04_008160 [Cadophora malorum]|uniref:Uncharacterized protein n=1 Tax=Cadophora malorum TaxID=108018 RepID=A0A8H7TGH2_9HELO|nr:hypothetical protein IFR04_008160 [Cadophora malorum]
MNPSTSITKGKKVTEVLSKKRTAPSESDSNISASQPASKKARTIALKTTKGAKPKKGPACTTCRKKKIKCAHRLELHPVTKHPSTVPSSLLANEQTKSATSINISSSIPAKAASHRASSKALEPTETATPAAPKKFRKLDEDRNVTPEFRKRIEQDRQKYTIQFTEEDWFREPKWANRVYKGWDSVDELLLHTKEPRNGSSAGKTPSLSFGETIFSRKSDIDIFQSFAKHGPRTYLRTADWAAGIGPRWLSKASQEATKDTGSTSSGGNLATTVSDAEKEWLKKVESWKVEAHALV